MCVVYIDYRPDTAKLYAISPCVYKDIPQHLNN